MVDKGINGVLEDRSAAYLEQLLRHAGTEASAAAAGGNDRGYMH
jgi:hypothetical protein